MDMMMGPSSYQPYEPSISDFTSTTTDTDSTDDVATVLSILYPPGTGGSLAGSYAPPASAASVRSNPTLNSLGKGPHGSGNRISYPPPSSHDPYGRPPPMEPTQDPSVWGAVTDWFQWNADDASSASEPDPPYYPVRPAPDTAFASPHGSDDADQSTDDVEWKDAEDEVKMKDCGMDGDAREGCVLSVDYTLEDWERASDARATYKWLRNETVVEGETGPEYLCRAADIGAVIRAEVVVRIKTRASATMTMETEPVEAALPGQPPPPPSLALRTAGDAATTTTALTRGDISLKAAGPVEFASVSLYPSIYCGGKTQVDCTLVGGDRPGAMVSAQWEKSRDGHIWVPCADGDQVTYSTTIDDIHHQVRCRVTPVSDTHGEGESVTLTGWCTIGAAAQADLLECLEHGALTYEVMERKNGRSFLTFNHKYIMLSTSRNNNNVFSKDKWDKKCELAYMDHTGPTLKLRLPFGRDFEITPTMGGLTHTIVFTFRLFYALSMQDLAEDMVGMDVHKSWIRGSFLAAAVKKKKKKSSGGGVVPALRSLRAKAMDNLLPSNVKHAVADGVGGTLSSADQARVESDAAHGLAWLAGRDCLAALLGPPLEPKPPVVMNFGAQPEGVPTPLQMRVPGGPEEDPQWGDTPPSSPRSDSRPLLRP